MALPREDYSRCVKLLDSLQNDPSSEPFKMPVAWKELQLFDYPQVV